MCDIEFLPRTAFGGIKRNKLAYKQTKAQGHGIIWCGGLKSDMEGTKAVFLHDWARRQNKSFIRFDYFGHGVSSGKFKDGNISRWTQDTIAIIDELTSTPQILVGSSMGGWVALLAALARPEKIKGLVLIAPAPDFTQDMWNGFDDNARAQIMDKGLYLMPSDYDEPYEISKTLIMDGRKNLLLGDKINLEIPIRILHGQEDTVVPWQNSLKLADRLVTQNTVITIVKDADHGMSRKQDLQKLINHITELCQ